MGVIDFVIIATIVLSGLFALYRGLVRELLTLVSWLLAVLCGFFGMFFFHPLTTKLIPNEQIAYAVTALVVALIVLVICTLITAKINKGLRKSVLSGLDRTLGFVFGVLRGLVAVMGVYFFCVFAMTPRMLERYQEKNFLLSYLGQMVPVVENILPDSWVESLQSMQSFPSAEEEQKVVPVKLDEVEVKKKPENNKNDVSYDAKDLDSMDNLIEEIE